VDELLNPLLELDSEMKVDVVVILDVVVVLSVEPTTGGAEDDEPDNGGPIARIWLSSAE
jgi:hypothetical protein